MKSAQVTINSEWSENWLALTRGLRLSEGFQLIFVFADEHQAVDFLREQLVKQFNLAFIEAQSTLADTYQHLEQKLSTLMTPSEETCQAVWVDLHRYHSMSESLMMLLARLNERREWLRNGLNLPIIFIVAAKVDIGHHAPDFWSIRDLVIFLDNTVTVLPKVHRNANYLQRSWFKITDWFTGTRGRYNDYISYKHRVFNIKGLRTRDAYTIELEKVFVELRIAPLTTPRRNLLAVEKLQGNQPIWKFLRYGKTAQQQLLLAVIGAPGCGKTTLLQHLALTFSKKPPHDLPRWLPILLFLRQHVKTILDQKPLLADVVEQHFANSTDLKLPTNWFRRQLQAGQCLLLLDGLDEVANAEERQHISLWIDEQSVNYPHCPFIVTSRPQGYRAAPLARATMELEVQPFTTAQVHKFIDAWYLATEIMNFGGKNDAGVRSQAQEEANDLKRRLRLRSALEALTVNPLLLTMIAMVHRYRGQLPGKRVELYAEICDVLLGHWRAAKGIEDNLTAAQKRVALQPLAAWMMMNKVREIEVNTAIGIIREPLQTVGLTDSSNRRDFFKDIQDSSGLLAETEIGMWSFAHLSFQEYLAAAHFKEQTLANDWWHTKITDSWWHETLRLYAAQADATPIVTACLQNRNVASLTLAADCLEEALKLDASVRQNVERLLIANLKSNNAELFTLAAEVKLQRRLKNLQRLDDTREIDQEFISCAEYQLFVDDMQKREKFYQPIHWLDSRFARGTAMEPIKGVRAKDAQAFCIWLSEKEKVTYRCPTLAEAQEFMPVTDINYLATWCEENGKRHLHWKSLKAKQDLDARLDTLFKKSRMKQYVREGEVYNNYLDIDFNRALALALDRALYHVRALDRARDLVFAFDFDLIRASAYGLAYDLDLYRGNFTETQQYLQEFQPKTIFEERKKGLLVELLVILTTDDYSKRRQAWQRYVALLAEYAVIGYEILEKEREVNYYAEKKRLTAQQGLWLHIFAARREGKLPAWEGIRIVRDRSKS